MFSTRSYATLLLVSLSHLAIASQQPQDLELRGEGGGWTNAYCISSNQDLTAATSAQCPSWALINCNAIQEPNYCCTPSTYCARAFDNTIGCCPWGQTCNPVVAGTWQPQPTSTIWQQPQPSTVYVTEVHPTTTLVYAAGQNTQQVTTVYNGVGEGQGQGQYCSTLYAHGGNLPTTEAGTCGTILIANAAVKGVTISMTTVICVLLALGGVVLRIRL
ncbi:uncharacterized protein M437DRAFT_36195 [Aureobasidium melanogenum CBS 110374]|uniref:GPI anchored protein n=1 Tax=Aureobasidium melanogenum (strain CBS 110374) TaxID=1043003 RepID=A0A074WYZ2_AURM1|nr:uncharacterized protein M437DRAFT_36195 [Aureobasidium melanogenum CBS 110374]KEQ67586.1 hypothetical protein M437DRAFT_36195 [Aureobasidium melanogenum CBS 110374]